MIPDLQSDAGVRAAALLVGLVLSAIFAALGYLVAYRQRYSLIAGYNREPESVRRQYDIRGLSKHVGDGLITLGVLLTTSAALFRFGLDRWATAVMGLFVFIAFIIVIGSRKFTPAYRDFAARSPVEARHAFLRSIAPPSVYRSIEQGTRQWLQECKTCGRQQDFWEAGGLRWHATGQAVKWSPCARCGRRTWHRLLRKTDVGS